MERKAKLASPNFVVSSTRLSVRNIPLAWNEAKLRDVFVAAVKERASKAVPVAKQVKILKDAERPGPDGEPRSKGFGFVEFTEHEHALCALRQLNNNPTAFHKVCAWGSVERQGWRGSAGRSSRDWRAGVRENPGGGFPVP